MTARNNILKRIHQALENKNTEPVHKPDFTSEQFLAREGEHIEVIFAENFTKGKGDFFYCPSLEDFLADLTTFLQKKEIKELFAWDDYLQKLLQVARIDFNADDENLPRIDASLTLCELLVARTGSILISSQQAAGRRLSIYPQIHIVLAFTSQLVNHIKEALQIIHEKYSNQAPSLLTLLSGPSTLWDQQKNPIHGIQGPQEIVLFLVDDIVESTQDLHE